MNFLNIRNQIKRNISTENDPSGLIERADQVTKTQTTVDPKMLTSNDQFEEEIKLLMEKHGQGTDPEGPDEDGQADSQQTEGEGNDDAGSQDAEQEAQGDGSQTELTEGDKKPEVTPEDAEAADKEIEQENANAEGKPTPDAIDAAEADPSNEQVSAALEALQEISETIQSLRTARETGRIGSFHMNVARESMNVHARKNGVKLSKVGFATEAGMVESIMEFLRKIYRSLANAVNAIFKWVGDLFRGFKARSGEYEKTDVGIKSRIKALRDTKAEVPRNTHEEEVNIPKLRNIYGKDIKSVMASVADIDTIQASFVTNIASDIGVSNYFACYQRVHDALVAVVSDPALLTADFGAWIDMLLTTVNTPTVILSEKTMFGRHGASTGFGNAPFFRDNVSPAVKNGATVGLGITNLVGGNALLFSMMPDNVGTLEDLAVGIRAVDVKLTTSIAGKSVSNGITLLASHEEIEQAMAYRKVVMDRAFKAADESKKHAALVTKLDKQSKATIEIMQEMVKLPGIDPAFMGNLGVFVGSSVDSYARLTSGTFAKLSALYIGVADGLDDLIKQSMAAIEEKMKPNKPA